MSLFGTMGIGISGLQTSQLGMDVSGQNLANADVEGYSRKRLNTSADYTRHETLGQMGNGVLVKNIERMRDTFLDQQIQGQNTELGTSEAQDSVLKQIENLFIEPSDTGLQNYMDQFFDSWQNLANNPADPAARTSVKTSAEAMVGVMHNVANELMKTKENIDPQLEGTVAEINKIVKQIYGLNKEVSLVEVNDQNANDSRDKRDKLVGQLAKLIDITVLENSTGQISVSSGGSLLVSPVFYQEIETYARPNINLDATMTTSMELRFKDSKAPCNPTGGVLRGLLNCRDKIIPQYQAEIDELARGLVEKVNEKHVSGFNLYGYSGLNFFNSVVSGASDIDISQSIKSNINNIAAAGGGGSMNVVGTVIALPLLNFGSPAVSLPKTAGPVPPVPLGANVARDIMAGTVTIRNGATILRENVDYRIDYPMGTIQMLNNLNDNAAITADYTYNTGTFAGPGDNTNAITIAQLRHTATMSPDPIGNATATYTEYYSAFIGAMGLERNESEANVKTRLFLIEQYQTKQDGIAGVSLDEEMANMVKYQHTYSAAARLISITNEMLNTLINM